MHDETIDEILTETKENDEDHVDTDLKEKAPEEIKSASVEELAQEMGWRPKENFDEESNNEFVDAATYIRRGGDIQTNMRKSIKDQKRQLTAMTNSIEELKQHNERVYKAEITTLKKDLASLKLEKNEAIQDGDVDLVEKIDAKIDLVQESISQPEKATETAAQPQGEDPEFTEWVAKNDWYRTNKEMQSYADAIGDQNEGLPYTRLLALVERKVKDGFPEKFQKKNSTTEIVNRVEGATRGNNNNISFTEADLTAGQKNIMSQFVRQGIMTKKQYIDDIKKLAGGYA